MKRLLILLALPLLFAACKKNDPDHEPDQTTNNIIQSSVTWKTNGIQNTSTGITSVNYGKVLLTAGDSIKKSTVQININFWNIDSTVYIMDNEYASISTWSDTNPLRTSFGCDSNNAQLTITDIDTVNELFSATFSSKNCYVFDSGITYVTDGIITNVKYGM